MSTDIGMANDVSPPWPNWGPVDAVAARVTAAGTSMDRGHEDSEPAGRVAVFRDPFGHRWALSTRREDYTPDEVAERTPPDAAPR